MIKAKKKRKSKKSKTPKQIEACRRMGLSKKPKLYKNTKAIKMKAVELSIKYGTTRAAKAAGVHRQTMWLWRNEYLEEVKNNLALQNEQSIDEMLKEEIQEVKNELL